MLRGARSRTGLSDREERRVRPDDGAGRRQEESMSYRGSFLMSPTPGSLTANNP